MWSSIYVPEYVKTRMFYLGSSDLNVRQKYVLMPLIEVLLTVSLSTKLLKDGQCKVCKLKFLTKVTNKLASLKATPVQNDEPLSHQLTHKGKV